MLTMSKRLFKLSVFTSLLLLEGAFAAIQRKTVMPLGGTQIRYHYDDQVDDPCQTIIYVGVGTAMSVDDYDTIAGNMATGQSFITVISDHHSGWPIKTNSKRYAKLANKVYSDVGNQIPVCQGKNPSFVIGGHSASGMAAINALTSLQFTPIGFLGLDPFEITNKMRINIPSMMWGFRQTTCAVKVGRAALQAYQDSTDNRVFYQVQNARGQPAHCAFTDSGCTFVCPVSTSSAWIRDAVATQLAVFVQAVKNGSFNKPDFQPSQPSQQLLFFVNEDYTPSVDQVPALRGAAAAAAAA